MNQYAIAWQVGVKYPDKAIGYGWLTSRQEREHSIYCLLHDDGNRATQRGFSPKLVHFLTPRATLYAVGHTIGTCLDVVFMRNTDGGLRRFVYT